MTMERAELDAASAGLFNEFPRLVQIQLEPDGHARVWFGTGIVGQRIVDDASFTSSEPSQWFTDAADVDDLEDRQLAAAVTEFVKMLRATIAAEDLDPLLPHVWHRTTAAPTTD